ncbi:MAG: RNA polymerase sigma factor [Nannocystales bacterium]
MGGESAATQAARAPSLRELFEAHYAFVWRTMRHFGLDEAAADDAAQDTFVVVHRRLPDYDGRTHIRGWLYGIARRVASTTQRGAVRARRRLDRYEVPVSAVDPDDAIARGEANTWVAEFLEGLSPPQRDVFFLADIEGLSAKDVASTLGVNVNTATSRLRLARERFDQALQRRKAQGQREGERRGR